METNTYECQYCRKEYIPKRRRVQKYCSNSCRSGYHQYKKHSEKTPKPANSEEKKISKIEKMSVAGVGNAAAGSLVSELAIHLFTKQGNKPATKKDLVEFQKLIHNNHKNIEKILQILSKQSLIDFFVS